jgi:hypothetical protein
LTPSFRRNEIIGHQLVKPDCSRFRPTKSVGDRSLHRCVDSERLLGGRADRHQCASGDENPTK